MGIWVNDLAEFSCSSVKLSPERIDEVVEIMLQKCYFIGVAEMALFFMRCKSGHYGNFFGTFDPMKFISWLDDYLEDRRIAVAKVQRDIERDRRDQAFEGTTSRNPHRARDIGELLKGILPQPSSNGKE